MCDLVSIITPSYNTAAFIEDTIRSVQAQTYTNWEMIIVDDCSTDNTDAVVEKYLSDQRIRYLKNEKNSGAAVARNYALREAKGRWIAFLDSDDIWLPQKLEKQIDFMEKGGYHFSYTQYEEVDELSNPLGVTVTGPKHITRVGMNNYCWLGCLTVMYDAEKIGLIQVAAINRNNDYAMWLKVCRRADCYLLQEKLSQYRRGRSGCINNHGIFTKLKWHYTLFRKAEGKGVISALIHTVRNMIFGLWKKIRYVKHIK